MTALAALAAALCLWGPVPTAIAPTTPTPVPATPTPTSTPTPTPAAAPPPAPATLAPAGPPSKQAQAEARLHFQQGVALFKEQNYDGALAEFKGAYGISAEPIVLYNMALTYKALFRYAESVDTLRKYLDESAAHGPAVSRSRRAEVEKLMAEMRSLLADVTIAVAPPSAELRVDGRPVALGAGGVVKLSAGSHVVEASAPDFVAGRRELTVVAGTPQTVTLALQAIPRTGHVRIAAAQVGARVAIDGRDSGPAPVVADLPAGGHQLEVTAPGFAPSRSELVVAAGQTRDVTVVLEPPPPTREGRPFYTRWWFWTGVGAVAAVAAGAVLLAPRSTQDPLPGTLGSARTDL